MLCCFTSPLISPSALQSGVHLPSPIHAQVSPRLTPALASCCPSSSPQTAVDNRQVTLHGSMVLSNALMHAGTTVDSFLRENLDWLSRATNWAKFSATAGLGVIHRGHITQGKALMAPYLPREGGGGPSSPYSEGGALYALGFIFSNHGEPIRGYLLEALRAASSEPVQHGACLGLGLAALGSGRDDVFDDMKQVLYADSAVSGEGAGLGMGLLLAGTGSDKTAEMLAYAHETQHEKIIRGLAVGVALTVVGREEDAETLLEQMMRDTDPILRYGGAYACGLAYRGTANNGAIRRLLHVAVSDVSDDVRRAAVLNLGFVLLGVPEQCPRTVALLAESYNPHVRYGAAMAVGIACAATGAKEALALLEPLSADTVDFVRQGATIATAMVLSQQPEARVGPFRKQLARRDAPSFLPSVSPFLYVAEHGGSSPRLLFASLNFPLTASLTPLIPRPCGPPVRLSADEEHCGQARGHPRQDRLNHRRWDPRRRRAQRLHRPALTRGRLPPERHRRPGGLHPVLVLVPPGVFPVAPAGAERTRGAHWGP